MLYVNYDNYMYEGYSMDKEKGTVWGYSGEGYSMGIQWRRVQYGDTVEKGTVWGYSGERYSIGIQWRRIQYGDTEKSTVWGNSMPSVRNFLHVGLKFLPNLFYG